jgi:periplasmic protein TonB
VVHLAVIVLAARASGLTAAPAAHRDVSPVIYAAPKLPQRDTPPPIARRNTADPSTPAPVPDVPVPSTPDISPTLPALGAMQDLIDHLFDGNRGLMAGPPTGTPNAGGDAPLPANVVEKAVVALPGNATPRYPSMLQSAGVDGNVRAQFVVDTLGRVEQGSFRALDSTHDLFTASVREALARARFTPAEVGGRKVRQLVEQTFTFTISR